MIIRVSLVGTFEQQVNFLENCNFDYRNISWDRQNCIDFKYIMTDNNAEKEFFDTYKPLQIEGQAVINVTSTLREDFVEAVSENNIGQDISNQYYNLISNDRELFNNYFVPKYHEGNLTHTLKYLLSSAAWNSVINLADDDSLSIVIFLEDSITQFPEEMVDFLYKFYNEKDSIDLLIYKDWMYMYSSGKMLNMFKNIKISDFYAIYGRVDTSMKVEDDSLVYKLLEKSFSKVEIIE